MAKKQKYYVVWEGHTPGIYTEWEAAEAQVKGYPEAVFKAFSSREEAEIAYEEGPLDYIGNGAKENGDGSKEGGDALLKCKVVKDLNAPKDLNDFLPSPS